MKEIQLTQGKVTLVDDEDYEYLNQWKWLVLNRKGKNLFYAARKGKDRKTTILMHRLILGLTERSIFVDHKDRNGLNNCRNNIRIATPSENCSNVKKHKNSTSRYKGVCWHKTTNKWVSQIQKNKICTHLGLFDNEIDAAISYNKAAIELHGEFANPNII